VRDRDRLRQQVLEDLGWTIARVWSLDWYRDPVSQTRRLDQRLRELASRLLG
jgi:very-short-patch-repair endonuclease